jgi:DNA-binding XRE family transcriptional regulator
MMRRQGPKHQIIHTNGEELVVISREDYESLVDANAALETKLALAEGRGELLTSEEVDELLAASTPLAFWRRKRGMSQIALAEQLGTGQSYISDIEGGKRTGPVDLYRKLAKVLGLNIEDLLPAGVERANKSGPRVRHRAVASPVRGRRPTHSRQKVS